MDRISHLSPDDIEHPHNDPYDRKRKIVIPHNYMPRPYQESLYNCIPYGFDRGLSVWHRRAGKDKTFINLMARDAFKRVGTYFYILPYYKQARLAIWEEFDKTGFPTIDHFPRPLILKKDNQQMVLHLMHPDDMLSTSKARTPMGKHKPGSIIRFLGSDNPSSLVGPSPVGIVFSEFSLHKPDAWTYLEPILLENEGWALFNGTPRGTNHMWDMYNVFKDNLHDRFCELRTIEDTFYINPKTKKPVPVITTAQIDKLRRDGTPEGKIQQEYYCSFQAGNVGTFYSEYINALELMDPPHVTEVPWEPKLDVFTLWDLGISKGNAGAVWFMQYFNETFRFINYMEKENKPLSWWFKQLAELPYKYADHFAPHDIEVRDVVTLETRRERCIQKYDFAFTATPKLSLKEGINEVQEWFAKCWFDKHACKRGLDALKSYKREYDEERRSYSDTPVHDWASNGADAFRTGAIVRETFIDYKSWKIPNVKTNFHDRGRR